MNDVDTSHPLHEPLARELAERPDSRRIVVVYDSRSKLVPFCDRELPPADQTHVGDSPLLRTGEDVGEGPERACESKDVRAAQRLGRGLPYRSCASAGSSRDWPASTAR
jgi:hypothetical protein